MWNKPTDGGSVSLFKTQNMIQDCGIMDKPTGCNASIAFGYHLKPQLLHFQSRSLANVLGKQQKRAQIVGTLHPCGRPKGSLWFLLELTSAVLATWGLNLWMEDLSLCNSNFKMFFKMLFKIFNCLFNFNIKKNLKYTDTRSQEVHNMYIMEKVFCMS